MQLNLIYLGQILVVGEKFLRFIKRIKQNILKKRMSIIDLGDVMLIYLKVRTF